VRLVLRSEGASLLRRVAGAIAAGSCGGRRSGDLRYSGLACLLLAVAAPGCRLKPALPMPPERPGRASPTGRLLIVVVDKVTWHDLLAEEVRAPTLRRLAQEGAPGMMCVRAARGFGGEYATLGAGSRAGSKLDPVTRTSAEANAFQATERVGGVDAARAFRARTGWATDGNAIVHLGIGELLQQNEDASYPLQLGLLGAALRRAGIRVAVIGNADTADALHRDRKSTRLNSSH